MFIDNRLPGTSDKSRTTTADTSRVPVCFLVMVFVFATTTTVSAQQAPPATVPPVNVIPAPVAETTGPILPPPVVAGPTIEADAVTVRPNIVYKTVGKTNLEGDLHLPTVAGPKPAVLLIHGGAWSSGTKLEMALYAQALARHGFVVFNVNYRLSPGVKFPTHLEDCVDSLRFLRSHAAEWEVDPARIGVLGYSAGGHLAVLLALAASDGNDDDGLSVKGTDQVAAVAGGGTVCEFDYIDENSALLKSVFGATRTENPALYQAATLPTHVTANAPPVFLFHGTADIMVPIAGPKRLADQLRAVGVSVETLPISGGNHIGVFLNSESIKRSVEFFEETLMSKP